MQKFDVRRARIHDRTVVWRVRLYTRSTFSVDPLRRSSWINLRMPKDPQILFSSYFDDFCQICLLDG